MVAKNLLGYFHPPSPDDPAWAGWSRIVESTRAIAASAGWRVVPPDAMARAGSVSGRFILSYGRDPQGPYGLVAHQVHQGPFWQIDKAVAPWQREVSRLPYVPESIDRDAATIFYRFWRDRFYGNAPNRTTKEGFVTIALQGDLTQRTGGQYCAPLDVVGHCLVHEPDRPLVVSIAADETYPDADLAKLGAFDERHSRLSVRIGDRKELLRTCDYVVTQSGSVSLDACFFGKTPILFAQVDSHHIGLDARDGKAEAFETASQCAPDFASYATWFLRDNAINVQSDDATEMMVRRLAKLGWPV